MVKYQHIAISVRNLKESLKFYKDVFGFMKFKRFRREDLGIQSVFLRLEKSDLYLELIEADFPEKNKDDSFNLNIFGIKHICFEIENVESKHGELKEKGYEVTDIKEGKMLKKYFFIKDPDGFGMELCEM